MAARQNISSKLVSQDSRLRFYGGYIYGSVYWVPVDPPPVNHFPETDSQAENHFSRIPDDIIARHMFDKMPDTETLCSCSLVSKHFASLVLDTQSVSLKIPSWRPVCICHPARAPTLLSRLGKHILDFMAAPFRLVWRLLTYLFRPEPGNDFPDAIITKPQSVEKFLSKFPSIQSLIIDLFFIGGPEIGPGFGPLLRWKLDKKGFVFVSAKNRDNENDVIENVIDRLGMAEALDELNLVMYHFMDGFWRIKLVDSILNDFPCLKRALVKDCIGQGRVELDEEDIKCWGDIENDACWRLRVWRLAAVRLPVSGCVMREVTVCVFREVGLEDGEVADGAFEEGEYDELARTVVKNETYFELKITLSEEEDGALVVNVE